jgi:hypothetical protein
MSRELRHEPILRIDPDGRRTLLVLPAIPEDAPPLIQEAISRRRIAALAGQCPCGAPADLTRQQRRARQRHTNKPPTTHTRVVIEHQHACPASDQTLIPLLRQWIAADPKRGCA